MSANTLTIEAANAAGLVTVGPEKGSQAVHDLVTAYRANRRTGSANTKTRGEVAGNNRKIYRQKGTGNARHGDHQSPIFVGGGVVFGPRPCDYSKKVNKSTRKLALRRVLGDIITGGKVVTVPSFSVPNARCGIGAQWNPARTQIPSLERRCATSSQDFWFTEKESVVPSVSCD